MDQFRNLIHELHRRSIWQVLSIYMVGSWGALQVVDGVTENAGLPDWVPPLALVLLVIGLPIVLATAFVQEGMRGSDGGTEPADEKAAEPAAPANLAAGTGSLDRPSTRPRGAVRLFTWRNAIGGGAAAGLLVALSVGAYFLMRVTGVGPAASLAAQGVFEAGEPVILAQFGNTSNDPSLAAVVTEALRVDLGSSSALTVMEPARIRETLDRMEMDPGLVLTPEVAAEVAVREGIKAVLEGEVGSAGSGYILVATLRAAETGAALATFRRTAAGPDEVIGAIDGLSQDIREKAGESLRTIKAEKPLGAVTTASLEALRLFTEADDLSEVGQYARAKELLEQAVELDPDFAMAWRKLAVVLQTAGEDEPGQKQAAVIRAYELRDHLTEAERYLAVAYYHQDVTGDVHAQIRSYRNVLDKFPDDQTALNNLSIAYQLMGRYEDALELLDRAVGGQGSSAPAYTNWVYVLGSLGRVEEAWVALDSMERVYPDRLEWNLFDRWWVASIAGDLEMADAASQALRTAPNVASWWRMGAVWQLAATQAMRGHPAAARELLGDAVSEARSAGRGQETHYEVDLALLQRLVDGDAHQSATILRGRDRVQDRLAHPPITAEYILLIEEFVYADLIEEATAVLDEWANRDGGDSAGPVIAEYRALVEGYDRAGDDPAAQLAALERWSSELGCLRCTQWARAERAERAGGMTKAAELYQNAMGVTERFESFSLIRVVGHERLGRVYEALGRDADAAHHYARFAELWADADPELQPRVRTARERAAALGGS